mmetsp:Transcript_15443/g.22966  ORF Transcript_15443/g.22966 Transcript_15443/m.22966 type:complete len:178 (+) Transcript_15443:73-606(+)|eukprot:CAMPEP_0171461098 /NCGR_PEP_ID=MMETSP0945-20130129/5689_1 /TAXON_ID=109269 /ORGANISM="Vaucheria litorea, Strain CCMP2940" /LENGTH=177 /DNA_ID=CAMNT_0011987391 /DNA_START=15 /DNA_END=548 /DNA_ORIENTATION=+
MEKSNEKNANEFEGNESVNYIPSNAVDDRIDSDDEGPKSSAENLIPTEQIQNGLKTAKNLWLIGWNGVKDKLKEIDESEQMKQVKFKLKEIEESEQMKKVKEATAPVIDKAAVSLNEVNHQVGNACCIGLQWTEDRLEDAKPHLVEFKEKAIGLTSDFHERFIGKDESGRKGPPTTI